MPRELSWMCMLSIWKSVSLSAACNCTLPQVSLLKNRCMLEFMHRCGGGPAEHLWRCVCLSMNIVCGFIYNSNAWEKQTKGNWSRWEQLKVRRRKLPSLLQLSKGAHFCCFMLACAFMRLCVGTCSFNFHTLIKFANPHTHSLLQEVIQELE